MGHVSAIFVRKVADAGSASKRRERCEAFGISTDGPANPKQMIADADFFGLLERVAEEDEDGRSVAFRVGASMRCDDYGAFGLAFKSAVDLVGSFRRVERYGKIVTSTANYEVVPGDGRSFMRILPSGATGLGVDMTNELAVSAATALCREVSRHDFSPAAVYFAHGSPAVPTAASELFGCPIHYEAGRNGLEIENGLLRAGNRLGDQRISEFFDSHLDEELATISAESPLVRQIREEIIPTLSEGVPAMARVAGRLGMSSRTLQRRLAAEDRAFLEIVESIRRDVAEKLLIGSDYSIAEIAFLSGFAEQSSFTRAFRRWNDETPRAYRAAHKV